MSGETLLHIWRWCTLALGAFNMGFAIMICVFYVRHQLRPGPYGTMAHVLGIAASYVLLVGGLWFFIFDRAVHGDPITWRLPLATVSWGLGVFAMVQLVLQARDSSETDVVRDARAAKEHAAAVLDSLDRIASALEKKAPDGEA